MLQDTLASKFAWHAWSQANARSTPVSQGPDWYTHKRLHEPTQFSKSTGKSSCVQHPFKQVCRAAQQSRIGVGVCASVTRGGSCISCPTDKLLIKQTSRGNCATRKNKRMPAVKSKQPKPDSGFFSKSFWSTRFLSSAWPAQGEQVLGMSHTPRPWRVCEGSPKQTTWTSR